MSKPTITSFDEFWPYYVGEHRKPLCRGLHYVGSGLALGCVAAGAATLNPLLLVAAPVVGYGFAWVGHFFVESNKPASFDFPLWSFRADWKMCWLGVTGRMGREVTRLYGSPSPGPDAPLLVPT